MDGSVDTVRGTADATREERLAELRMWVIVRRDLAMPPGKLASQVGHGFAQCLWRTMKADPGKADRYMETSQAKVAVGAKSEDALRKAVAACHEAGLVAALVEDAGRTVFGEPTVTVGAVGPCLRGELPKSVAKLRLFEGADLAPVEAGAEAPGESARSG